MKRILCAVWLLNSIGNYGQSTLKTMSLLPDTGQTNNYTATFGEDSDYSINTPSYLLDNDGTVTDLITGLMWQRLDGGEMTFEAAQTYCENLTLGTYDDWRLPSPIEAFSILNHQHNNPAIDTNFFTTSNAEYWWTNGAQVGDANKVWCTNAGGGIGNHPKSETISAGGTKRFHVRAVRQLHPSIELTERFTDHNNGTVTDELTQLTWQKVPNATAMTWEQALDYAEQLTLAGNTQWRLPNIKELQSLHDPTLSNPAVSSIFNSIGVRNYWSSTSLFNQNLKAWYWNTQFGITTYDLKTNSNYVLCVSGEPSLSNYSVNHSSFQIYPIPADAFLVIDFEKTSEQSSFSLYNALGQKVSDFASNICDTSTLPNGIYFLTVHGGKFGTQKVVVQH